MSTLLNFPKDILKGFELHPPTTTPWNGTGSAREIVVLMSGGVDSSVAALQLKRQGWNVLGISMLTPLSEGCSSPNPMHVGAQVAREIDICHYVLDVRKVFEDLVMAPFRRGYSVGRTPNPCVGCNGLVKFGAVWQYLEETFGVRRLATGHYANIDRQPDGRALLRRGADSRRDQSYFIYWIPRARIGDLHFLLGDRTKDATRALAREAGLSVAEIQDSMDFCLLGKGGDYRTYLAEFGASSAGEIREEGTERVLGHHQGIEHFTLGQRKGLPAVGMPIYVSRIDPASSTVYVGTRESLVRTRVDTDASNILMPELIYPGSRVFGKIRSQGEPTVCTVLAGDPENGGPLSVEFEHEQFAPAPGQHLVLYTAAGHVVGGGIISRGESRTL